MDKRKSLIGYLYRKVNIHKVVALSSTRVEYAIVTFSVMKGIWLKGLVEELGYGQGIVVIHCDNHEIIHLSKNPQYHERTKHVDEKLHFIRDVMKLVELVKIHIDNNPADMFTKIVPLHKFSL